MMARIAAWSSRRRTVVIVTALLLAAAGQAARSALSRDVIPDLSDPQIVLVVDWMGHPAVEVAGSVTNVLTRALDGIPGSTAVRGSSMSGMAYIDVVFASSSRLAAGRAEIVERIARARASLPTSARIQVGPLASSTGWVFQYVLIDPARRESPLALRRFQDDVLRPALASIPGVAEVASVGGAVQQLTIEARPDQLRAKGLAFTDLLSTVRTALGQPHQPSMDELRALPIVPASTGGSSPPVRDVAYVRITNDMPSGLADLGGAFQAVGGIVVAERNADLTSVVERIKLTLDQKRSEIAGRIEIVTVHDRLALVNRVGRTLLVALAEEILVVVLVILVFLLHGPSALVPLTTLPVVLSLTFGAMWILGVPATLMSLGGIGIALGMAVDADVVTLEACNRRLETIDARSSRQDQRAQVGVVAASLTPAILTSLMITAITFLPVFAFTGETGRLLRPLAITKTLIIVAAGVVALTLAPALRDRWLRAPVRREFDNPLTRGLVRAYGPFVHFALARPLLTLLTAGLAVASCLPIVTRLGGEFLPRIDEGDLLFMPTTLSGVPPEQALTQLRFMDRTIAEFQEVATVFGKVGRAETATDPAPYSMAEITVRLRPRSEWPKVARTRWYSGLASPTLRRALGLVWPEQTASTTAELVDRMDRATRLPGWTSAWTAPVRARMDMMSTGVRTPVGIRIVAENSDRLDILGGAVRGVVSRLPGTRSVVFESLGGETRPRFVADSPALLAATSPIAPLRDKVAPAVAQATADLLLNGGQIGEWEHDGRRLRARVLPNIGESTRAPLDQLRAVTVRASGEDRGEAVPLALLGRLDYQTLPATLRTERGHLVAYVYVDLAEGTDLVSYVKRAQHELDHAVAIKDLRLDAGERWEWAGQYDLLAAGEQRLKWIIPVVALSMLGLLFLQFRSLTEALIVLVSVPFALVGSIWALFLWGYPLSAPVWVGLLSVLGLAMQTGVVMVVYIDEAFHRRLRDGRIRTRDDIVSAHAEGTVQRLRPKIMTITTMAAGLLPLLWAEGAGAEIMKRVAAPMIGGLATSAFLTLEVLPVLYTIWRHHQLRRAARTGVSIETIVGLPPGWARLP
jgi:Cu(I)/Ag(I) efflux system membrane protein CusA/SilA